MKRQSVCIAQKSCRNELFFRTLYFDELKTVSQMVESNKEMYETPLMMVVKIETTGILADSDWSRSGYDDADEC